MKKLFIFAMAFGLAACQTDKTDVNGGQIGDVEANYLTINITAANGGTRADYDNENGYEDGWEEGAASPQESEVKEIRFYFFNDDGSAASVDLVSGASYRDFTVPTEGFADNGNDTENSIEHKLAATVVLHRTVQSASNTTGLPTQVIAVLNPTREIKALIDNPSLDQVKNALVKGLAYTTPQDEGNNLFMMTNSVYTENGQAAIDATPIKAENIKQTEAEAINGTNPVQIYVERVVAKIEVSVTANTEEYWDDEYTQAKLEPKEIGEYKNAYDTFVTYGSENKKVYVVLEGWNATATANKSYLVKHIDPSWDGATGDEAIAVTNLFQTVNEPWNYEIFKRSFWAYNPSENESEGFDLEYGSYSESKSATDKNPAMTYDFDTNTYCYLPENAGVSANTPKTKVSSKVIIAAQLIDEEGQDLALFEFMGTKMAYTSDDDVKKAILNVLTTYYTKENDSDDTKFTPMNTNDLEIKTALELDESLLDEAKNGRYYVYAQLTSDAADKTWYKYTGTTLPVPDDVTEESFKEVTADDINKDNLKLLPAKVWKAGKTYYYFDIRHLSQNETAPGYYGVVRNHVYKTNIKGIFGLGTPVYDPDEIIIPEKPQEEDIYLAAEINILSWRIVNSDVELEW